MVRLGFKSMVRSLGKSRERCCESGVRLSVMHILKNGLFCGV